jgi:hypothetical protein
MRKDRSGKNVKAYRPAAGVQSVWDEDGILLVHEDGKAEKLNQLESAVWQMTCAGISEPLLHRFIASLCKTSIRDAERFVTALRKRRHVSNLLNVSR